MARSFLVPINLNNLELQNFRVHNIDSDPTGSAGRLYYNTSSNSLKFYNGTSWLTIATGGSTFTLGSTSVSIGGTTTTVQGLTLGSSSVWNGNTIDVAYGGTGTATGSITGTGTLTFTAGSGNNSINLRPTGSGSVDLGSTNGSDGFKITGLKDPSTDYDAANKKYVDSVAAGLNAHPAVNYATTGALGTTGNLVGGTITTTYNNGTNGDGATLTIATSSNWTAVTIDSQPLTVGDRVLIKNQGGGASSLQNGIYTVTTVGAVGNTTSFVFTRATDSNSTPEVAAGDTTYVLAGAINGGNGFVQTAVITTLGTTPIAWSQYSGSSTVLAGDGLQPNGTNPNQLDVVGTADRITVGANSVDIASTYVGQTSITTLGTVATGTWSATTIATNKGGTGLTSFTNNGAVYATSTSALTTGTLPVASGGTGATTFTSGSLLKGNGTSAISVASASDITTAIGSTAVTNATNATNATNSTNVATTLSSSASTFYPTFVASTTNGNQAISNATSLTFVPSTGTLSATVFSGSGASLTSLNGSNISSGTVAFARLAALYIGTTTVQSSSTTQALTGISSVTGGTTVSVNGAGNASGSAYGVTIQGGANTSSGIHSGGSVTITGGAGNATQGIGGSVTITAGSGSSSNGGGSVTINAGAGNTDPGLSLITIGGSNTYAISLGMSGGGTTTTVTGTVKLPTVGTSGFVKLGAGGQLSADTSTYLTSATGVTTVNGSSGAIGATANSNGAITRYYRATNSAGTTTTINHAYGQWVLVQVYKTSDGTLVDTDVANTATNGGTTTVTFAVSQTAGDYTIVIIG